MAARSCTDGRKAAQTVADSGWTRQIALLQGAVTIPRVLDTVQPVRQLYPWPDNTGRELRSYHTADSSCESDQSIGMGLELGTPFFLCIMGVRASLADLAGSGLAGQRTHRADA